MASLLFFYFFREFLVDYFCHDVVVILFEQKVKTHPLFMKIDDLDAACCFYFCGALGPSISLHYAPPLWHYLDINIAFLCWAKAISFPK